MSEATLNISDIQHFSVGDGEGIRTTLFLKGCNLRCPWCHNPETVSPSPVKLHYEQNGVTVSYGRIMTVSELLSELLADKEFYDASGGGVTVSGGEPLLQPRGVAVLGERLSAEGVRMLVDTAGCVPLESIAAVAPVASHFYFDLKSPYPEDYRRVIGGDIERVKAGISYLTSLGVGLTVRIPLIPGFNTSREYATASSRLLSKLGVRAVDLLPFHRLGSGKYKAMGLDYAYKDIEPLSHEVIEQNVEIYKQYFTLRVEK